MCGSPSATAASAWTQQTLARAIEPFFSTKGVGKGTGLGLSMVHGLAAQLGGVLDLTSSARRGNHRRNLAAEGDRGGARRGSAKPARPSGQRGAPTILLVDDEELVRIGTAEMLGDLGYKVIEASFGRRGSAAAAYGRARLICMITDYLMPGMNGAELIEHARPLARSTKLMLITGYSNVAEGPAVAVPRLAKPFRQADLAEMVADLLTREPAGEVVQFPGRTG